MVSVGLDIIADRDISFVGFSDSLRKIFKIIKPGKCRLPALESKDTLLFGIVHGLFNQNARGLSVHHTKGRRFPVRCFIRIEAVGASHIAVPGCRLYEQVKCVCHIVLLIFPQNMRIFSYTYT